MAGPLPSSVAAGIPVPGLPLPRLVCPYLCCSLRSPGKLPCDRRPGADRSHRAGRRDSRRSRLPRTSRTARSWLCWCQGCMHDTHSEWHRRGWCPEPTRKVRAGVVLDRDGEVLALEGSPSTLNSSQIVLKVAPYYLRSRDSGRVGPPPPPVCHCSILSSTEAFTGRGSLSVSLAILV